MEAADPDPGLPHSETSRQKPNKKNSQTHTRRRGNTHHHHHHHHHEIWKQDCCGTS